MTFIGIGTFSINKTLERQLHIIWTSAKINSNLSIQKCMINCLICNVFCIILTSLNDIWHAIMTTTKRIHFRRKKMMWLCMHDATTHHVHMVIMLDVQYNVNYRNVGILLYNVSIVCEALRHWLCIQQSLLVVRWHHGDWHRLKIRVIVCGNVVWWLFPNYTVFFTNYAFDVEMFYMNKHKRVKYDVQPNYNATL